MHRLRSHSTKVQFLILACLARHPMHIYAVRQEIIELSNHTYYPVRSTIKQAVEVLLTAGFIEECQSDPQYWMKARRGAPYELTEAGSWRLDRETAMYLKICRTVRQWRDRDKFGGRPRI